MMIMTQAHAAVGSREWNLSQWTVVYRKSRANRYRRAVNWHGTWDQAQAMAIRFNDRSPELDVWITTTKAYDDHHQHEDAHILTSNTGKRIPIMDTGEIPADMLPGSGTVWHDEEDHSTMVPEPEPDPESITFGVDAGQPDAAVTELAIRAALVKFVADDPGCTFLEAVAAMGGDDVFVDRAIHAGHLVASDQGAGGETTLWIPEVQAQSDHNSLAEHRMHTDTPGASCAPNCPYYDTVATANTVSFHVDRERLNAAVAELDRRRAADPNSPYAPTRSQETF